MRKQRHVLKAFSVLLILSLVLGFQQFSLLPVQLTMLCGESHSMPAFVAAEASEDGFLLKKNEITPLRTGAGSLNVSLFGLFKKSISVDVIAPRTVTLGGQLVGIKLYMDGAVVVGISEIPGSGRRAPGKEAGIAVGDRLLSVNGTPLSGSGALEKAVAESDGNPLTLTVRRDEKTWDTEITPVYYPDGESYKLGLWVRESAAGVGTVTFAEPSQNRFAALGHAIEDVDTGASMEPARGTVTDCKVAYIAKSEAGIPGEISAVFGEKKLGAIEKNTDIGLYGHLSLPLEGECVPIAVSTQAEVGNATVYSAIAGGPPVGYAAEIRKIFPQKTQSTKNMIVRITDERLLRLTGGIVQGMSGSPIIQNGRIVGAVTHVFVNDPTRGYGIFIENMLAEAEKIK